jgi:5-methylcytosine-specific restriction endonuclease McrA
MANTKGTPIGGAARGRTPPGTPTLKERWNAARAAGDRMFDPGVACVNGHDALRWANNGICVECKRARDNAYNAAHTEEHLARTRKSVAARPDAVRSYRQAYYKANKETAIERARLWGEANPERQKASRLRSYQRNRSVRLAAARARHAANPEPFRAARRKWKRNNPHKVRAAYNLRRSREIGAQSGDRRSYAAFIAWSRLANRIPCYWCKRLTRKQNRHLDHVIPLAKGGADSVGNLCVSCPPCNQRKNAKMPEEFAGQSEFHLI